MKRLLRILPVLLLCILTLPRPVRGVSAGVPADVPAFAGEPYADVNGGEPFFTKKERAVTDSFESYGEPDALGRCAAAFANVGTDLMPAEPRGEIGGVKPTGWQFAKYDFIDGKYLYNRCHLIGYQLTGENANPRNLITGTRYLNVKGMLPFENRAADYVKETGCHVLYRVTPVFEADELVARGVLMEAWSVEDDGGLRFCVFCYNVQPGVSINYATGESALSDEPRMLTFPAETAYAVNRRTGVFHLETCPAAQKIAARNRVSVVSTAARLTDAGNKPCGVCRPDLHEETVRFLCGDVDRNGTLQAADARTALRFAAKLEIPDERALALADADPDGRITAGDARLILRAAVGLEVIRAYS